MPTTCTHAILGTAARRLRPCSTSSCAQPMRGIAVELGKISQQHKGQAQTGVRRGIRPGIAIKFCSSCGVLAATLPVPELFRTSKGTHLPELGTDLVAALASLDVDNLPHGCCCFKACGDCCSSGLDVHTKRPVNHPLRRAPAKRQRRGRPRGVILI